jgi:hypothetical protein
MQVLFKHPVMAMWSSMKWLIVVTVTYKNLFQTIWVIFCSVLTICIIVSFWFCHVVISHPYWSKNLCEIFYLIETHGFFVKLMVKRLSVKEWITCIWHRFFKSNEQIMMSGQTYFKHWEIMLWLLKWKTLPVKVTD